MAADLQRLIQQSKKIDNGPTARYQLQLKRFNLDKESDEESKLRKFTLGEYDSRHQNKTILLVGATGSGKSTLINALVNFVMGVEFEDKVWFEVISDEKDRPQCESQTSAVSVYEIFGFEGKTVPYSLTIIDTPGFGHTEDIENDEMIIKLLQGLFCHPEGVDTVNAVGLVMKATVNRLDERMVYIFNSVMSLFDKDMEKNIVVMMTHSDGGKPRNALKALEEAKIICAKKLRSEPIYFKFNNRQKETIEDDSDEEEDAQNAFKTSNQGMKKFTKFLETAKPQSVDMTLEVMKERSRLTACVQNLKERVTDVEMKQEVIRQNREELSRFKEEMEKNKNFHLKETFKDKEDIKAWWDTKAVTCNKCEENCHYPGCTWAWSPSWCYVMRDGKCTSCSGKCPVEDHVKEKWKYVTKTRRVTIKIMNFNNEQKKTKMDEKTILLEDLEKEEVELELKKNMYLKEAFSIMVQLEKITLNKDSVSTYIHLDFLIEKMKETRDTEKVQKLEKMRDRMDEKNKSGAKHMKR